MQYRNVIKIRGSVLLIFLFFLIPQLRAEQKQIFLTMEEAINRTLSKNNQIKASQFGLKKATWDQRRAWTLIFPVVSLNSRYMWIDDSTFALRDFSRYFRDGQTDPSPMPGFDFEIPQTVFQNSYATSIDVDWQIFNATIFNGLAIAGTNKKMAQQMDESTQNNVLFEVISSYLNVVYTRETLRLQKEYLELSRLNFEKAERMHQAGRYSKMEALRWKVDYQQQLSQVTTSESFLRSAQALLKRVLNFDMDVELSTEENIPNILKNESEQMDKFSDDEILSIIHLNDDDLIQANAALAAAKSNEHLSKLLYRNSYAAHLPNVSVSYQYAWRENNTIALDDYSPQTFLVNLSVPLFSSFRDYSESKSTYYAHKQSQEQFADQLQNTRFILTETANKIINLKTQRTLSKTNVEYNDFNYRIAEQQKEEGLVSNIDFVDAKLNLQNARLGELKNEFDYISAIVELYYLTGRLSRLFK